MSPTLRILIVEDSDDDTELLLYELRRAGYDPAWGRVDTAPAMRAALEHQSWDIVTSDHAMPRFNAPAALALLKEIYPDLPFIIVSNEIDLNLAVSLMKAGAQDYIQKRELAKVVPAIQRELREVALRQQRQQAEVALRESESRYRGVFETVADALFLLDQETGAILDVNEAACQLYGYTRDEMLRLKNTDMSAEPEKTARALKTRLARAAPRFHRKKRGDRFPVDITASYFEQGSHRLSVVAIRDMTARIEAETALQESERKCRDLAESLPLIVYEMDVHGNLTFANHAAAAAFGYRQEEFERGMHIFEWLAPEDIERFRQNLEPQAGRLLAQPAPYTLCRKDGSTFSAEVFSNPVVHDQLTVGYRGIIVDITERRQAEAALRESEKRYRDLAELLPLTVYECELDGRLTFVNRSAFQTFGYTPEDFEGGLSIFQALAPEEQALVQQEIQRLFAGGAARSNEYTACRKDGQPFPIEICSTPVWRHGQPVGLRGIAQDITARKQLEKQLAEARALIESAFEQAPVPMVLVSAPDLTIRISNSASVEFLGIEDEPSLVGQPLFGFKQTWQDFDAEGQPLPIQEMPLALALKGISTRHKEYRVVRKDSSAAWGLVTAAPIYNPAGELIAALWIFPDITERRQAEELNQAQNEQLAGQNEELRAQGDLLQQTERELRESQERYQLLFEHAAEGIAVCQNNRFRFINPALSQLFGYTREVLLTRDIISFVCPDDRTLFAENHTHRLQGEPAPIVYDFRVLNDHGEVIWVEANSVRIEWEGAPAILAFYTDITARKHMEAALQESALRYQTLAEATQDMIFIISRDDRIEYVNSLAASYLGRAPQVAVGQPREALFHGATSESQKRSLQTVFETGRPLYRETVIQFPDREVWLDSWLVPLQNAEGQVTAVIGSARDITARKRVETELVASRARLKAIFDNAGSGIAVVAKDGRYLQVNDRWAKMLGCQPSEICQKGIDDFTHPEDLAQSRLQLQALARGEVDRYWLEKRFVRPDGRLFWGELSATPIRDPRGEVEAIVNVIADITERRRAEAALRESEERLRQVTSSLREAVWLRDTRMLAVLYVNPAYETIWGRTCESLYQNPTSFTDAIHPEDRDRIYKAIQRQAQGIFFDEEYRILRPDGAVRWVWGRTFPVRNEAGEVYRVVAVVEDITARKEAEATREDQRQVERLVSDLTSAFFNPPAGEVDREIVRGLQRVVEFLEVERGSLYAATRDKTGFQVVGSYVAPGFEAAAPILSLSDFPWYVEKLLRGETIGVEQLDEAPTPAAREKDFSEKIGLKSTLSIPIRAGGAIWGTLVFVAFRRGRAWPAELIAHLKLIGEVFANVLIRRQAEETLQQERGLFIAGPVIVVIWGFGPNWPVEYMSANITPLFGYTPEDLTSGKIAYTRLVHPDDRERVLKEGQLFLQSNVIWFEQEYRLARADGEYRWVHDFTRAVRDPAGAVVHHHGYLTDITARKQAEAELLRRNKELETIGRLFSAIATNLNLQEILDQALRGALELTGLEGGTLCLVNQERQTLTLAATQNISARMRAELSREEVKVGTCLCGHVAQTGQALILWDKASGSEFATREAVQAEALRFHGAFPLISKDQTIGILCLFARTAARPTPHRLELIQQLCGPIALAIDNARLYAQAQGHAADLEQRVAERTVQLAATNQELEAFSYSVAHDLRAPLRNIEGYSQALAEDFAGQLDTPANHYLQRIRAASARMSQLIEDLLELSRLTRGDLECTPLDLSALARAIADELQQRDINRQVEFIITPGITARADARLLRAVLENLLGNAWKFTSRRAEARIEFGECRVPQGRLEVRQYFVRDNGSGFDMANADKLFKAFQRLHSADEFPGTGIGLATVKRIISRHGGQVWAESAPDQGATFYFTL